MLYSWRYITSNPEGLQGRDRLRKYKKVYCCETRLDTRDIYGGHDLLAGHHEDVIGNFKNGPTVQI